MDNSFDFDGYFFHGAVWVTTDSNGCWHFAGQPKKGARGASRCLGVPSNGPADRRRRIPDGRRRRHNRGHRDRRRHPSALHEGGRY